jgi:hypothetical protein
VLQEDVVVRLRRVQDVIGGKEETGCCIATIITSLLPVGMKEVEVKIKKDVDLDNNNEKEGGKKRSAECITLELRGDMVY